MKKVLEVKNVTKIYKIYKSNFDRLKEIFLKKKYHKEFISNNNISFDLFEAETIGIIGVNGAGKSTILKIITGVIEASSGIVNKYGRVTALLELGTGFNDEQTGYDNIFLNGTLIGMTQIECEEKKDKIIEFSELGEYIYEPIKTYSSGMKMRLAFSIAIFSEPQILIVDEALSVGDAHFQAKCISALKLRREQNMSIIYVSHDLSSLKLLCNRVILLNNGELISDGEPELVINKYNYLISKINDKENKIATNEKQTSSFGTFDIEITKVSILSESSNSDILNSGENAVICVEISSKKDIENMTVGIMIRDKFGQDIFGTNTFHHKVAISFNNNKKYKCFFSMPLNIGIGKYTITAAVHSNENHLDNCSHWLDHATSFEVTGNIKENFIGICKLYPKITIKEI
ncbi:ABC transporter ATP-binding protein [Poseidonibacter antarcticus]|uniref:ABC transporter ATP-binding protein n=1 Tax=Poseidonibacter antarcticus TaxID=2478538 RepID=UPI000EF4C9E6|nr:ABC transporter ATP-binding protein [Poseidonibacter antarcticus]